MEICVEIKCHLIDPHNVPYVSEFISINTIQFYPPL